MQKRTRKAFTLLELIVVVVVLGILALVAVPSFRGVINNAGSATAAETARGVANSANALASFNTGADTNVTTSSNVECALLELNVTTDQGYATEFSSGSATITLDKNGNKESYVIAASGSPARAGITETTSHASSGIYANTAATC